MERIHIPDNDTIESYMELANFVPMAFMHEFNIAYLVKIYVHASNNCHRLSSIVIRFEGFCKKKKDHNLRIY